MDQPGKAEADRIVRTAPNIMSLLALAAAVEAARSTGLLAALLDGPATAAGLAARLGLDARAAARVLDLLVAVGLAQRANVEGAGDGYGPGEGYLAFGRYSPGGVPSAMDLFGHAGQFLRTGEPLIRMDASAGERGEAYRNVVGDLGRMFGGPAADLASRLGVQPADILDVGCGSGVWSLAIAARSPTARVTGQDLPPVLAAFEARASELGLGDRIALLPGDMHRVDLPQGRFDLAVIANVLRLEQPERARSLVARVAAAVRPGGHLLVIDALEGGTPEKELARTAYALHLALRTRDGTVHSPADVRAWMTSAGLREPREVEIPEKLGAVGALLGQKG